MSYPQSHLVVSVRQRQAIQLAKANNDKMIRHRPAYWAEKGWDRLTDHFTTNTIEALIIKDFADITSQKLQKVQGSSRKYKDNITEITLTEKGRLVQ